MKTPVAVEIYYSGAWHDITATDDVYTRDPITISPRGRPDEVQRIPPTRLAATINNRDGTYSPRNPMSPLYGLIGRNTPARVTVAGYDVVADTFNRPVTEGWGTCEYGALPWSSTGAGGSVLATDYRIDEMGTALHGVFSTSAYRMSYLPGFSRADVTATVRLRMFDPIEGSDVLGNDMEGGLMLRLQDVNHYYHPRVEFNSDQTITASLHAVGGTGSLGSATVTGVTFSGQYLTLKAQCLGTLIRMKVWEYGTVEPSTWHVSVTNTEFTAAGSIGCRSGRASGNTNTLPFVYYQRLTIDPAIRFTGEVEAWPQAWTTDERDAWTSISAWGILRRLGAPGQTSRALSALVRYTTLALPLAGVTPVDYWPMEEGILGSDQAASGLAGGAPLTVVGEVNFATTVGPTGSNPLPGSLLDDAGYLTAMSTMAASPTVWQVSFVVKIDPAASGGSLIRLSSPASTTLTEWNISYTGDGVSLGVDTVDSVGTNSVRLGEGNLNDGLWHHVVLKCAQSGGNVSMTLYVDYAIADGPVSVAATLPAIRTVTIAADSVEAPSLGPIGLGHVLIVASSADIYSDRTTAMYAHVGDTAGRRIERLLEEEGITLTVLGNIDDTALVGVQRPAILTDLLQDAADVDMGILYEPRTFLGFAYRTRASLYNQTAAVSLTYGASGEVAPPLQPIEDTDHLANDVSVTRYLGSSGRSVQTTGQLNVSEPSDDPVNGVGRYPRDPTLILYADDQCVPAASWLRHVGTHDEARYPVINFDLTAMTGAGKSALVGLVASLDVGDRASIASPPPVWAGYDSVEQIAQGFTEVLESHRWSIGVNATPALPYDVFELESHRISPAFGATTTSEALDTTETGVDIVSTTVRFIDSATYASMFPFDILIGGERMTVTAITGTTLSQTMTVTRSVNGVVKTHLTGARVALFRPSVIAL
jgi:hypothetical protein